MKGQFIIKQLIIVNLIKRISLEGHWHGFEWREYFKNRKKKQASLTVIK